HQLDRKSENVGAITHIAFQFEMDPPKHKRKGYKRRQNAAPHDQKMHQPAKKAAFENKMLADEVFTDRLGGRRCVLEKALSLKEKVEPSPEIRTCRRPLQPDRIAKYDRSQCNYACNRVTEQRRIEVLQIPRPDDHQNREHGRRDDA